MSCNFYRFQIVLPLLLVCFYHSFLVLIVCVFIVLVSLCLLDFSNCFKLCEFVSCFFIRIYHVLDPYIYFFICFLYFFLFRWWYFHSWFYNFLFLGWWYSDIYSELLLTQRSFLLDLWTPSFFSFFYFDVLLISRFCSNHFCLLFLASVIGNSCSLILGFLNFWIRKSFLLSDLESIILVIFYLLVLWSSSLLLCGICSRVVAFFFSFL